MVDERHRELAAIIDEDLERLQSLVTDTVQMVRVDSGDFTLRPNDHQLSRIVAATLRQYETRLDGHPVVTRVPDTLSVRADGELVGLALRQLLDNAVKYSPQTSAIEIRAASGDAGTIDISVRNSGPPIPEGERGRLFDRFYRGSQARRVPGTGMGLAIVRQIAEAHRGGLSVSSRRGRMHHVRRCRLAWRHTLRERRAHSHRGRRAANSSCAPGDADRAGLQGGRREARGGGPRARARVALRPRAARHQHAGPRAASTCAGRSGPGPRPPSSC